MGEVKVKGEDLNGLGWTIKSLIDRNMKNPKIWNSIKKIKGSLVVRESGADIAVSGFFDTGEITIQDGAVKKPSAWVAAGFDELAELTSGQIGPIRALLFRKIKAGGNLLKLLKMAKAVIDREEE